MAELRPEDPAERQSFDYDTKSIYGGDPLQHVEEVLTRIWGRMLPQQGTMAALCTIMSTEVAHAPRKKKLEVGTHGAHRDGVHLQMCYCPQCREIRSK